MNKLLPYIPWWIFTLTLLSNFVGLNPYSHNSRSSLVLMAWLMGSTLIWVSVYIKEKPTILKSILKTMAQIVLLVMIVPLVFGLFMQIFITQGNLPPVIFLPLMVWSHLRSYPLDSLMWLYILTAIVIGFKETWKWWKRGKTHSYD